jgi:site-specific recombinase XerD
VEPERVIKAVFAPRAAQEAAPLSITRYLRHGFASLAFAAGAPLKVVSDSLGHSGIGITGQLYVHLLKAATLDSYLDRAVRPICDVETAS